MLVKLHRKPKLRLVSSENQHYIQVPSGHGGALVEYLRRSGLHVSPPSPCTADSETVAFVGKVDSTAVQALLTQWK